MPNVTKFRFRLRTLLIATAVLCALIAWLRVDRCWGRCERWLPNRFGKDGAHHVYVGFNPAFGVRTFMIRYTLYDDGSGYLQGSASVP